MQHTIHLCLGPHRTARDAQIMDALVGRLQPDVVCPEFMQYTREDIDRVRAYVRREAGIETLEEFIGKSGWKRHTTRELECLRDRDIPVAWTDLPQGHPWFAEDQRRPQGLMDPAGTGFRWRDFCAYIRAFRREEAMADCRREDAVAADFPSHLQEALDAHPALRAKASLNILFVRGTIHGRLADVLRRHGTTVQTHYTTSRRVERHTCDDELHLRYKRTPRARPSDDLAFRAWLTRQFYFSNLPQPEDSRLLIHFHRSLASLFTAREMHAVFREALLGNQWEAMEDVFRKRSSRVPQHAHDVPAFLQAQRA